MEKHTKSSGVKAIEFIISNIPELVDIMSTMLEEQKQARRISVLNLKALTLGLTYNERKRLNCEIQQGDHT